MPQSCNSFNHSCNILISPTPNKIPRRFNPNTEISQECSLQNWNPLFCKHCQKQKAPDLLPRTQSRTHLPLPPLANTWSLDAFLFTHQADEFDFSCSPTVHGEARHDFKLISIWLLQNKLERLHTAQLPALQTAEETAHLLCSSQHHCWEGCGHELASTLARLLFSYTWHTTKLSAHALWPNRGEQCPLLPSRTLC